MEVLAPTFYDQDSKKINMIYVHKGEEVKKGDLLFNVETVQGILDIRSEYTGTILDIKIKHGGVVDSNQLTMEIYRNSENLKNTKPEKFLIWFGLLFILYAFIGLHTGEIYLPSKTERTGHTIKGKELIPVALCLIAMGSGIFISAFSVRSTSMSDDEVDELEREDYIRLVIKLNLPINITAFLLFMSPLFALIAYVIMS
ncbi:lipoyl domain-containing protein [Thalassotalea ganghwensis]